MRDTRTRTIRYFCRRQPFLPSLANGLLGIATVIYESNAHPVAIMLTAVRREVFQVAQDCSYCWSWSVLKSDENEMGFAYNIGIAGDRGRFSCSMGQWANALRYITISLRKTQKVLVRWWSTSVHLSLAFRGVARDRGRSLFMAEELNARGSVVLAKVPVRILYS